MQTLEGPLNGQGQRHAILCGRFNSLITEQLLKGAIDGLKRHGVDEQHIDILWAPGAYELPLVARAVLEQGRHDAVIALGAVIRGSTPHFDHVAGECSKGLAQLGLQYGKPVIFGVLTTDTIEQAIERAGTKAGNKGFDAAMSAIEMVNLLQRIQQGGDHRG